MDSHNQLSQSMVQTRTVIGKATFDVPPREQILTQNVQSYLSKMQVMLCNKEFNQQWQEIFALMNCTQMSKLYVWRNYSPNIICCLNHINFQQMIYLNLSSNNIVTLEHLASLNAPKIFQLYLHDNKIIEFTTMRKTYFPELSDLSIEENKTASANFMSSMCLAEEFSNLSVQQYQQADTAHQISLFSISVLVGSSNSTPDSSGACS